MGKNKKDASTDSGLAQAPKPSSFAELFHLLLNYRVRSCLGNKKFKKWSVFVEISTVKYIYFGFCFVFRLGMCSIL
eukprot:UN17201